MNKNFILKGVSAPLLAAMVSSVIFSASPSLLFAATDDGTFVTDVDNGNGGSISLTLDGTNKNFIDITVDGDTIRFRYFAAAPDGQEPFSEEIDAIIQKCFPSDGTPGTGEFTAEDVQAIIDFFNSVNAN